MDAATLIASTIALGAVTGVKETATQAVKDGYSALMSLLRRRYGGINLAPLEARPTSEAKRASLVEDLRETRAADDAELLGLARELFAAIEQSDPEAAGAVGVDLRDVRAAFLNIGKVSSSGSGVRVTGGEFTGGISIAEVDAGNDPKDRAR